ncbi:hypothetical protein ACFW9N_37095 [Streptomyces sp. NPDC059496]|uniref:hypothetical protein n=1 Tax=Streptomyces sp. NPDC059496 TaxID=3346851 RepID=UPI0036B7E9D4
MARAKQDERLAFFDTYGAQGSSPAAEFRRQVYEARDLGAIRLERHRLGNTTGVQVSVAGTLTSTTGETIDRDGPFTGPARGWYLPPGPPRRSPAGPPGRASRSSPARSRPAPRPPAAARCSSVGPAPWSRCAGRAPGSGRSPP